jgi:hypothetical protein
MVTIFYLHYFLPPSQDSTVTLNIGWFNGMQRKENGRRHTPYMQCTQNTEIFRIQDQTNIEAVVVAPLLEQGTS